MRARLCPRPHELTLVERPKPEVAPRSALVRLRRAGVCGADLHIFEGTQPYFGYPRAAALADRLNLAGELMADHPFPHWLEASSGVVKALIEI